MRQLLRLCLFVDVFHGGAEAVILWVERPDGEVAGCEAVRDAVHGLQSILKLEQGAER